MNLLGANDAVPLDLDAGGEPRQIADDLHGAVQVINLGDAPVAMGAAGTVTAANGVLVEPGTAQVWHQPSLWLAATGGVAGHVRVTSTVTGYTPSPEAVAGATAAQLLASGVPIITRTGDVLDRGEYGQTLAPGEDVTCDVSGWTSVLMVVLSDGSSPTAVSYSIGQVNGAGAWIPWGTDLLASVTGLPVPLLVPVTGGTLRVRNVGLFPAGVQIIGSSRVVAAAAMVAESGGTPRRLGFGAAANAGDQVRLIATDPPPSGSTVDAQHDGTVFDDAMSAAISTNTAGVLGFWAFTPDGSVQRFDVAQVPAGGLTRLELRQPKQAVLWTFRPDTAGALAVSLVLWRS